MLTGHAQNYFIDDAAFFISLIPIAMLLLIVVASLRTRNPRAFAPARVRVARPKM